MAKAGKPYSPIRHHGLYCTRLFNESKRPYHSGHKQHLRMCTPADYAFAAKQDSLGPPATGVFGFIPSYAECVVGGRGWVLLDPESKYDYGDFVEQGRVAPRVALRNAITMAYDEGFPCWWTANTVAAREAAAAHPRGAAIPWLPNALVWFDMGLWAECFEAGKRAGSCDSDARFDGSMHRTVDEGRGELLLFNRGICLPPSQVRIGGTTHNDKPFGRLSGGKTYSYESLPAAAVGAKPPALASEPLVVAIVDCIKYTPYVRSTRSDVVPRVGNVSVTSTSTTRPLHPGVEIAFIYGLEAGIDSLKNVSAGDRWVAAKTAWAWWLDSNQDAHARGRIANAIVAMYENYVGPVVPWPVKSGRTGQQVAVDSYKDEHNFFIRDRRVRR